MDESGYTSEDLMNEDQQWFVLAPIMLTDGEARSLFGEVFQDVKAQELKHNKLRKTHSGQNADRKELSNS